VPSIKRQNGPLNYNQVAATVAPSAVNPVIAPHAVLFTAMDGDKSNSSFFGTVLSITAMMCQVACEIMQLGSSGKIKDVIV
jgi:hypothetical protein